MAVGTQFGFVTLWEDFVRNNVTDLNETVNDGATQDILDRAGGWWRQVLAGDDTDAVLLANERCFEVDEGAPLELSWRGRSTGAAVTSAFIGFHDNPTEAGAVIIENENGALNTVATDAFGFLLEGEAAATGLTWQATGVQSNADNPLVALTRGANAEDDVTQTLRMEAYAHDSGTCLYYIDGLLVATQNSWFRSGIIFNVGISCDDRNTGYNLDTDYIFAQMPRGN